MRANLRAKPDAPSWPPPLIISHAACRGSAPENTRAGIRAALALNVDAIEIDVHASADGIPVLIHDDTLDRTTNGSGPVSALRFAALRRLDAGSHGFAGRFAGEQIPSLAEVVELTRERCLLIVEIKQPDVAALVVEVLRQADALPLSMIWSFHLPAVAEARRLEPLLPGALLSPAPANGSDGLFRAALRENLSAVSVHYTGIDAALVRAARLRGLTVYTWTADDPDDQRRLAAAGVDGIVTNVPAVLAEALRL
ncbi:MAG: glycerophosphodiester phosphodiesterase [Dehalococcoidia bacterium]